MRILTFSPFFLPSEGGGERVAYNLSKEYLAMGHDVTIVTFNCISYGSLESTSDKTIVSIFKLVSVKSAELPPYEFLDGLKIYRFPYISVRYILSPHSILLSPPMLSILLRKVKPDIIHIHGVGWFYHYALFVALTRMRDIPFVLTTHGLHEFYHYTYIPSPYPIKKFLQYLISFVFKKANKIIALSKLDIPLIENFGVDRHNIAIIPNGVDLHKYSNPLGTDFKDLKEKYKLREKVGLTVTSLKPSKGINYLIKAISNLKQKNISFLIVGDHSKFPNYVLKLKEYIQKLGLQDMVILTGWLPEDTLVKIYQLADFFVLPTLTDTFPLVLLESMASGKPIVATNVGGIPEIVDNYKNGILVPPRNSKALAKAIASLINDHKLCIKMGKEAKKKLRKEYDWTKIAEKTLEVYQEIIRLRSDR